MPIIENDSGESLLVKRLGIEFLNANGILFRIDSEPVSSVDYSIAAFFDTIECDSSQIDLALKKHVIWKVFNLAIKENIRIKFFDNNQNEIIPIETKHPVSNPNNLSIEKKEIVDLISVKNYKELDLVLKMKPYLLNEKYGFDQESLLHFASKNGDENMCNFLIDLGINVDVKGKNNETPLVRCAENGNLNIAKILVSKGAAIDGALNSDKTPLIAASGSGNLEVVKFLLSQNADITKLDSRNLSAFEVAKYLYHEDVVAFLKAYE